MVTMAVLVDPSVALVGFDRVMRMVSSPSVIFRANSVRDSSRKSLGRLRIGNDGRHVYGNVAMVGRQRT